MTLFRSVFLTVIVLPILSASFDNIRVQARAASVLRLAKAIEKSGIFSTTLVDATLRDAARSGLIQTCQDEVSRSIATIHAYLLNQQLEESLKPINSVEFGKGALGAVDHRLTCSPADGNAWLMRAQALQFQKPNSPEVIDSLAKSYRYAPAEFWVMEARFKFALAYYDFIETKLGQEFSRDLNVLVQYAPIETVAENYLHSNIKVRDMIYMDLVKLPKRRGDMVAQATDRLGVTLRGNGNCSIGNTPFLDRDGSAMHRRVELEICGE